MIKKYVPIEHENEIKAEDYYTNGKTSRGETVNIENIDEDKYKEVMKLNGDSERKALKRVEKLKKDKKDKKDKN